MTKTELEASTDQGLQLKETDRSSLYESGLWFFVMSQGVHIALQVKKPAPTPRPGACFCFAPSVEGRDEAMFTAGSLTRAFMLGESEKGST